jgi:endoglycosylceramidase
MATVTRFRHSHHQAFAPHGYDIVTDTPNIAQPNSERIELIYHRHVETSNRLGMPTLVGEWGAFGGHPNTLSAAQMVVNQIEKHLFSDTYWAYSSSREMDQAPYFPVLSRPYPVAIAGILLHYESNLDSHNFNCVWREEPSITDPSLIYLPEQWFPKGYSVNLQPDPEGWFFEPIMEGSSSGYLVIPPTGEQMERQLTVQFKTKSNIE